MTNYNPISIGAALKVHSLQQYLKWIMDNQRDLEIQDFVSLEILDGDWKSRALEIKSMLDGYQGRLGIHGPFWGFKIDSPDPLIRSVVNKRLHQGLDVCEMLGASQMVVHSPFSTWDYNNFDNNPNSRDLLHERVKLTMADVIIRAEEMKCELVIENIEDKDPLSRVELVRYLNSPSVRVSIDTGHAHYAHVSTGAPPVDYYVHAAGNLLSHIHLQDADGYADRHWKPGDGTILWASVFKAIRQTQSDPRLVLELRNPNDIAAGFQHLHSLGLVK
jgi:sugar phosphate isomerase/epimerase